MKPICWILLSSGTLRSVDWLNTDVSGQPIGPIFKGQVSSQYNIPENGRIEVNRSESLRFRKPKGCPETSVTTNVRCVPLPKKRRSLIVTVFSRTQLAQFPPPPQSQFHNCSTLYFIELSTSKFGASAAWPATVLSADRERQIKANHYTDVCTRTYASQLLRTHTDKNTSCFPTASFQYYQPCYWHCVVNVTAR
jgi:hypothetical protein